MSTIWNEVKRGNQDYSHTFYISNTFHNIPGVFKDDPLIKQVRYGVETQYSIKLPMGADYDDYYEDCYARIQDTLGAGTVCSLGRIKVHMAYPSYLSNFKLIRFHIQSLLVVLISYD